MIDFRLCQSDYGDVRMLTYCPRSVAVPWHTSATQCVPSDFAPWAGTCPTFLVLRSRPTSRSGWNGHLMTRLSGELLFLSPSSALTHV